jgi:hypothetical protein
LILDVAGKIDENEEYQSPKEKSKKKDRSFLNIELKDMKNGSAAYDEIPSDV